MINESSIIFRPKRGEIYLCNLGKYSDSEKDGFWLGWDYAHCGDYTCIGYNGSILFPPREHEHMWTTGEVLEDIIDTICSLEYCAD